MALVMRISDEQRTYPSFTAVLQVQGNVEDHKDAGRMTIKDWTELPVAECVRTAQDRMAWRAKVSQALASQARPARNEEE